MTPNKKIVVIFALVILLLAILTATMRIQPNKLNFWPKLGSAIQPPVVEQPVQVMITATGFIPATVTVKAGQQITWINQDKSLHQVASDPHPFHTGLAGFDSLEPLKVNETYAFTLEKSGTFTYHDHLNPLKLKGTIIVK